ncbi:hypothetical protein JG687_00019497 [Phytophthora cactorum]|uniref:Uncharacterized protein n=1 Tax=Phytophthora cactorum TaxID=29920 RepID=A0A8T1TKB2_9STRA|nr:hypothetical protein JG687_00019497 [Phytophthora cactorum]
MQNNDCWFVKNIPPETNGPCQAKRTASPRRTRAPRAAIQAPGRIRWLEPSRTKASASKFSAGVGSKATWRMLLVLTRKSTTRFGRWVHQQFFLVILRRTLLYGLMNYDFKRISG